MSFDGGFTVWLTGLPCSGKSTIALRLAERLLNQGRLVEVLDGDIVRQNLSHGLSFTREDRDRNVRRVGFVASLLSRNGVVAIVALVSPYRSTRNEVRATIERFVEVHVDCPLSECERRDVKGMYRKARGGAIPGFTGIDDPYERPERPEVTLNTSQETPDESTETIVAALREFGYGLDDRPHPSNPLKIRQRMMELGVWRPE